MSTSGHLKFQGTNRATFVGTTSNIMFDTTSTSLGIGVTGTDHPSSNLYITGNAYVSSNIAVGGVLTMGTVNVVARHDLEAVTATGNITPLTIEFTNPTTSLVASGNVVVTGNVTADHFVGDGSNITGISSTLQAITDSGNVTSNTVQFSNAITGFVTTANVEVGGELTVSGNVAVDTNTLFVDSVNDRVGIGTTDPGYPLQVDGTIKLSTGTNDASGSEFNIDGTVGHIRRKIGGNGVSLTSYDDFRFYVNATGGAAEGGTQRVRILNNGNVGIGTSSPSLHTHIKTNNTGSTDDGLLIENTYSSNTQKTVLRLGIGSANYAQIDARSKPADKTYLTFSTQSGTGSWGDRMTIDEVGNVGIGTSSPNWPLEVSAGNNSITYYGPNGSWTSYLAVGAANDKTIANNSYIAQCISTNGNLHLDAAHTRDIYMNHYSGAYIRHGGSGLYSDDRLKSEEELITNATDTLLKLSPQKYLKRRTLREDETRDPITETGLIAQDIWYDAPELRHIVLLGTDASPVEIKPEAPVEGDIQQDPDYSSWGPNEASVNYDGLIAYLIKSNQELHARIAALENA